MLRFFRHIRQRLFLEGKVSRYFGYAIGEIVLIVVGILIAVQISEWNQAHRNRIEEGEILKRISDEIEGHIAFLSGHLDNMAEVTLALKQVESVFEGEPIENNVDFLSSVVRSGLYSYLTPRWGTATYEELVNSGKQGLIRSVELRDSVSEYYRITENYHGQGQAVLGRYGLLTFDLIPRKGSLTGNVDDLSHQAASKTVSLVLNSELHHFILPQRNRLNFLKERWNQQIGQANELLAEIEVYIAP